MHIRDAHVHIAQHGRSKAMLDLGTCTNAEDMIERIADATRQQIDPTTPILAHSVRPQSWDPPCWPSLAALDNATGCTPCLAWCFDYHALMANSAMLSRAQITPDADDPLIETDDLGTPTGVLFEHAAHRVWNALPVLTDSQLLAYVTAGLTDLGATFTELHDLKSQPNLGMVLAQALDELHANNLPAPQRIELYPMLSDIQQVLATRSQWESDSIRLAGIKIFVDGTLNSRTAWVLEPWADAHDPTSAAAAHPQGVPVTQTQQIVEALECAAQLNLPLAAHAIGDAAVRAVLDAIETAHASNTPPPTGCRIEHAQLIHPEDVPRFAQLGVIASLQPCHLLYDIEAIERGLHDRLDRVLPVRSLIDAGCLPGQSLLFGSDTPIVRPNPADSILAATKRQRDGSLPSLPRDGGPITPDQAISLDQAMQAFAVNTR